MGVRGLRSLVQEKRAKLLQDVKLKDTKLVIDGSNLLYFLYSHFEDENIYGGNYDHFSTRCRDFFNTLLKCNILPIVIFDGADDPDNMKLETVLKRLDERFRKVNKWEKTEEVLPILSQVILYQILDKLKIPHIATVYEADNEIAVLANRYECPVLTDDSDFYVYNLKGGSISMACMVEKERTDINGRFYLPVKLYKLDIVIKEFFQMEDDEYIFPVFATLAGNDFFDPSNVTLTYPKRPREKMSFVRRNIRIVKEYMCEANFENGKNAYDHICSQLTQEQKEQFKFSVDSYLDIKKFTLFDLKAFIDELGYEHAQDEPGLDIPGAGITKDVHNEEFTTKYTSEIYEPRNDPSNIMRKQPNSTAGKSETEHNDSNGKNAAAEIQEYIANQITDSRNTSGKSDKEPTTIYERVKTDLQCTTEASISVDHDANTIQHHEHTGNISEISQMSCLSGLSLQDYNGNKLPFWFVQSALKCETVCTFLLNISQNHRLLFKAQPEIHDLPSSFKCAESIRRVIYRIVLNAGDNSSHTQQRIQEYHRKRTDLSPVKPIEKLDFIPELPRLETIPLLPKSERKAIVYATFKAKLTSFDQEIDESSQILILMLSLWVATSYPRECHVNAILIGIIALHALKAVGSTKCLDILNAIESTDKKDIENFKDRFGKHFNKQDYMKRHDINKEFVHKMSQFQAIFLYTHHLNKLLLNPVDIPSPSVVLNSTFNYNMCHLLENNVRLKNIFLGEDSTLYCLLKKWQHAIEERSKVLVSQLAVSKKKR